MPLVQLKDVTLAYGARPLLDAVNLSIEPGERVCLVGRNGAGKTSLMRLLTGEETANSGEIVRPTGTVLTRLQQEVPSGIEGTVLEVVRSGCGAHLHEEEWEREHRLEIMLQGMSLPADEAFSALSGGMKRRVLLARALAGRPDLLLLDEPTNHLDIDAILWLEQFLLTEKISLFFVTHDRAFLRKLATRIVELDRGQLASWECGYDVFLERRAAALEAEEKQWAQFDKKLAQEEAWLRQGIKARRTRNEGRVRALKALREERRQRRERQGTARIEIQEGQTSGQKVIEVENLSFAYPDAPPVVRELSTTIYRGDKVGIIGPNGGGKTTLLKLLLGGLEPQQGTVKLGTNLQVVYLDQLRGQIDDEKSVAWNVAGDAETVNFQGRARHIHSYLQDFLFQSERIRMPAKQLSGGERNRLLLARLFLQPANLLVLDEPTNDLDAETLELLEDLLVEFQGTLLLVSHDRAFLDSVVTGTLVFEGEGCVNEYVGGYEDWLRQRPQASASSKSTGESPVADEPVKKGKSERPRKFLNRERRELEELPGKIEELEARHEAITVKMIDPATYKEDPAAPARLEEELKIVEKETQTAYARWEELEKLRVELEGA